MPVAHHYNLWQMSAKFRQEAVRRLKDIVAQSADTRAADVQKLQDEAVRWQARVCACASCVQVVRVQGVS